MMTENKSLRVSSINRLAEAGELTKLWLPVVSSRVPAGFPSPADNYIEKTLISTNGWSETSSPPSSFALRAIR
jgi:hypothetical protein